MTTVLASTRLLDALETLRERLAAVTLPLELPGAPEARRDVRGLTDQLDDYVLPRLRQLDAPLLAVVGGSTGAGKSTLVNSIIGDVVSQAGVLRPTTRSPVLVHSPADADWFTSGRILPGLARSSGASGDQGTLHLVASAALGGGLALLDAPDIDSVVTANRELAAQLLAAADLWLFVTTAARYADAVPWELLHAAQERSAAVAVVLDRVPPSTADEVTAHLASMLADNGLGAAPLFVVRETVTAGGLLPSAEVEAIRGWLRGLAADAEARDEVVRRTLSGALSSLRPRVERVVAQAEAQQAALDELRADVADAYAGAAKDVDAAMSDGSLLRGEVLARWQEFVGTGELLRSLESHVGRLRDRLAAGLTGRPQPGSEVQQALETGVESLLRAQADRAAERATDSWRTHPAGTALLRASDVPLAHSSAGFDEQAARLVRDWQAYVLDLVRHKGAAKRSTARFLSYGVNGLGVALMVAVFAHTGGLTGAEVGVAGGTSLLSQKLLEAVFGDQAVRDLAAEARRDLRRRVQELLEHESARFTLLLDAQDVPARAPAELRGALAAVEAAR